MTVIETTLGVTRERAELVKFYPAGSISATNVQDAIEEVALDALGGNVVNVNVGMSPYTPLPTDGTLLVDTSGGAVTIQMPASATRTRDLEVKDVTGNAAANPISVLRNGAETIDGLTTYPIDSAYGAATFGPKTNGYYVHA